VREDASVRSGEVSAEARLILFFDETATTEIKTMRMSSKADMPRTLPRFVLL
jgi:hypothetical protein